MGNKEKNLCFIHKDSFRYIKHKDNKEQQLIHALRLNAQEVGSKFRPLFILIIPKFGTLSIWFSPRSPY